MTKDFLDPLAADGGASPFGRGYASMFAADKLSVCVYFPIEAFTGPEPSMIDQIDLVRAAERLGFAGLWARDVPLDDPSFGDLGQLYDPFVWLATIAAHTRTIALATGAVILPLHHPIDVAKAAASLDRLSGRRFVLGVNHVALNLRFSRRPVAEVVDEIGREVQPTQALGELS